MVRMASFLLLNGQIYPFVMFGSILVGTIFYMAICPWSDTQLAKNSINFISYSHFFDFNFDLDLFNFLSVILHLL